MSQKTYQIWVYIKCSREWSLIATIPGETLAKETLRRIKKAGYQARFEEVKNGQEKSN